MSSEKSPGSRNEFARKAKKAKIPMQMDNKDYGKKVKAVARNYEVKAQGDGHKLYGVRTIMTKENAQKKWKVTYDIHSTNREVPLYTNSKTVYADNEQEAIATIKRLVGGRNHTASLVESTFIQNLLAEANDVSELTTLPEKIIKELRNLIRKGAQDLQQNWKDALELVNKAYQVSNVRLPMPDHKGAWKQYMDLIGFGVQQLNATRGTNGQWRRTKPLYTESYILSELANVDGDAPRPIGNRRFFVEIPGVSAQEVDADSMDDIIEKISNKINRSSDVIGTKVRVAHRTKEGAILHVFVGGALREKVVIKEIS